MKIDVTLPITKDMMRDANNNLKKSFNGHLGTHFDVMNKTFPLEYTERIGIVFDVNGIDEIEISDIDLNKVKKDMFVMFYSGYIDEVNYGTKEYFKEHP